MLRPFILVAVLGMTVSAEAAESKAVTLSKAACARLVQHVPADDVTYKPGVDARGRPVVPADLGGGPTIAIPDEINIQIGIDLADRLALRDARRAAVPPTHPTNHPRLARDANANTHVARRSRAQSSAFRR